MWLQPQHCHCSHLLISGACQFVQKRCSILSLRGSCVNNLHSLPAHHLSCLDMPHGPSDLSSEILIGNSWDVQHSSVLLQRSNTPPCNPQKPLWAALKSRDCPDFWPCKLKGLSPTNVPLRSQSFGNPPDYLRSPRIFSNPLGNPLYLASTRV